MKILKKLLILLLVVSMTTYFFALPKPAIAAKTDDIERMLDQALGHPYFPCLPAGMTSGSTKNYLSSSDTKEINDTYVCLPEPQFFGTLPETQRQGFPAQPLTVIGSWVEMIVFGGSQTELKGILTSRINRNIGLNGTATNRGQVVSGYSCNKLFDANQQVDFPVICAQLSEPVFTAKVLQNDYTAASQAAGEGTNSSAGGTGQKCRNITTDSVCLPPPAATASVTGADLAQQYRLDANSKGGQCNSGLICYDKNPKGNNNDVNNVSFGPSTSHGYPGQPCRTVESMGNSVALNLLGPLTSFPKIIDGNNNVGPAQTLMGGVISGLSTISGALIDFLTRTGIESAKLLQEDKSKLVTKYGTVFEQGKNGIDIQQFKKIEFAYYYGCADETVVCTSVLVERFPEGEEPICIINTPDNIEKYRQEVENKLSKTKALSERTPVVARNADNEHANSRKISLANVCFRHEHGFAFSYALAKYGLDRGMIVLPTDISQAIRDEKIIPLTLYQSYIDATARLNYSDPSRKIFDDVSKNKNTFINNYLKPAFNYFLVRGGLFQKRIPQEQVESLSHSLFDFMSSCVSCSLEGSGKLYTALGCLSVGSVSEFVRDVLMTVMLGLAGAYCLFCIIASAITLQTSQGESKQIETARARLVQCIGGLLIVIFATLILRIVAVDILRIPFIQ